MVKTLTFLLLNTLLSFTCVGATDQEVYKSYMEKTNIIVASGFKNTKRLEDNFFNYYHMEGDYYLRVAHQYYGNLADAQKFDLDALAQSFLLRDVSERDWLLIFIEVKNGIAKIQACNIIPIENYPAEILRAGRESIVRYTIENRKLRMFCE